VVEIIAATAAANNPGIAQFRAAGIDELAIVKETACFGWQSISVSRFIPAHGNLLHSRLFCKRFSQIFVFLANSTYLKE